MTRLLSSRRKTPAPLRHPRLRLDWVRDPAVVRSLEQVSVGSREVRRLYALGEHQPAETTLAGRPIQITSPFWYLHGLKEIFLDQTYLFVSENSSPYILDCGANIGLSVIYFLRQFPAAQILAFEPDPAIFSVLKKNLKHWPGKVQLINQAVWREEGLVRFSADQSVGGSLMTEIQDSADDRHLSVSATRLRDHLHEPVDLLKIDIEGAEFEVLTDCRDRLHLVKHLFIEYHSLPHLPQQLADLLSLITTAGFRYYIKEAWENMIHPFVEQKGIHYDLQLNIFAYRPGKASGTLETEINGNLTFA